MASETSSKGSTKDAQGTETEILNVLVTRDGNKVSTKWGLHPELKKELKPEEWKELADVMARVSMIVGNRFSEVLAKPEEEKSGTA